MYTVRSKAEEVADVPFEDGVTKLFLYVYGEGFVREVDTSIFLKKDCTFYLRRIYLYMNEWHNTIGKQESKQCYRK